MISIQHVCRSYPLMHGKIKHVLRDISIDFNEGCSTAILGLNGAGKSTLIRIICGAEQPDSGRVIRKAKISWPIGLSGGINGSLSGKQNLRFVSRIYGADINEVAAYVKDFAELGDYMDMPVKTYSSGMKSKLIFGLAMAIGFDFYLVDEALSVGDAAFRRKAQNELIKRCLNSTMIFVSHSESTVRNLCKAGAVLNEGKLKYFPDINDALKYYKEICDAKAK